MSSLTLYFGGSLSDADWTRFAASQLTPNFPDGFTTLAAAGQWRDPNTGQIIAEHTRVVQIYSADPTARADQVIAAYRTQFHQISVGKVAGQACASF